MKRLLLLLLCLCGCAPTAPAVDFGNQPYSNSVNATDEKWADAARGFHAWSTTSLTPSGYPTAPAGCTSSMYDYPPGEYKLIVRGGGVVTVSGSRVLGQTEPVDNGDGSTTAIVSMDVPNGPVTLHAQPTDPSNPITSVQFWRPNYGPGTAMGEQLFTYNFLRHHQPFSTLRFMMWSATNDSPPGAWADRVQVTDWDWLTYGVPYEVQIALCNQLGKDLWINIPDTADADYVRQFAALVQAQLRPDLNCYVEWSNECWNFTFPQAVRLFRFATTAPAYASMSGHATEQMACAQIDRIAAAGQVFGAAIGDRARPIFAWHMGDANGFKVALAWLDGQAPVASQIHGIAGAPYVYLSPDQEDQVTDLDSCFAQLYASLNNTIAPQIAALGGLATQYGVELCAYEGAQGLRGTQNADIHLAAQSDPRMGQFYRDYGQAWVNGGGGLFMHFGAVGRWSTTGSWSLLEHANADMAASPKWCAVMQCLQGN